MSLISELKRRNVIKVAGAYLALAWVVVQATGAIVPALNLPATLVPIVVWFGVIGFPCVLIFSWAYELTPEGLKRESEVDRSQSITRVTSKRLDYIIIGMLAVAIGLFVLQYLRPPVAGTAVEAPATTTAPAASPDGANAPAAVAAPTQPAAPTPDEKSIAVLPFADMSQAKDQEYFSDGMSEELLNLLAKIPDLKVIARTSSFAFKGTNTPIAEIAKQLGVAHVLEGSVRKSGNTVRITAQLIRAADSVHLWSETYDRPLDDIFALQDEISGAVVEQLKIKLLGAAPTAKVVNLDAYALYLQAVALQSSTKPDDFTAALELLDRAIQLDSSFARAYELRASYYWFAGSWLLDAPQAQSLVYASAMKALELDPTLTTARSFAQTAKPDWNWPDEIAALEAAVRAEPQEISGLSSLTYDLILTGYFDEAIRVAEQIIERDPLSTVGHYRKGEALMAAGRGAEARASWRHSADSPEGTLGMGGLVFSALLEGNDDDAIEWLEKFWSAYGRDPAAAAPFVNGVRNPDGGKAYLDDWVTRAVTNAADLDERRSAYLWYLAFGYLDDYWEAIYTLSDGLDRGWTNADTNEQMGMVMRRTGYTRHPQYLRRSKAQGMFELWDARGPPDHCTKASGDWVCE